MNRLRHPESVEVADCIRQLSEGLTRDRPLAGEKYFSDPLLLGAYLLYFWPISYAQAFYALKQMQAVPRTVLDLGAGPGPLGCACLDAGAHSVTFADRSQQALNIARNLIRAQNRRAAFHFWDPQLAASALPKEKYDFIALSHVLNELWPRDPERIAKRAGLVHSLFQHLQPQGHILIIDPALTSTSRELLQVRDQLLAFGHKLSGPCLWPSACPALHKPQDTCHTEFAYPFPAVVQDLIRRAGFQKRSIKMACLLFSAHESIPRPAADKDLFLIVSDPLLSKNGRIRLIGCGLQGRLSLAMKPGIATDQNREFLSARRGDIVRVQAATPREGGLDITAESRVTKVSTSAG